MALGIGEKHIGPAAQESRATLRPAHLRETSAGHESRTSGPHVGKNGHCSDREVPCLLRLVASRLGNAWGFAHQPEIALEDE
jgi:hypothetical protein